MAKAWQNVFPAILAFTAACDSPSGPGRPIEIAINQIVEGSFTRLDTAVYRFPIQRGVAFFVITQVETGRLAMVLRDETSTSPLLNITQVPDGQPFGRTIWSVQNPPYTSAGTLTVIADGRFRFQVYVIDAEPETVAREIQPDQVIESEGFHTPVDIDEFRLQGQAGENMIAYLQATSADSPGSITLELSGAVGGAVRITSFAGDHDLERRHSVVFSFPFAGSFGVRIASSSYIGSYRLLIRRIERRPEHYPPTIAPNDTLDGERLDYIGDVDEFTLTGVPGELFNAFLQVPSLEFGTIVRLRVLDSADPDPSGGVYVESFGADTSILHRGIGVFVMPPSGRMTLRVAGPGFPFEANERGRYRLFVGRVVRAPEHGSENLALNDSVLTERIEWPGDIDEWILQVPTATRGNIIVDIDPQSYWARPDVASVGFALRREGEQSPSAGGSLAASRVGGDPFDLAAGTYRLAVSSAVTGVRGFHGSYQLRFYQISDAPEGIPDRIALGDTISERISPLGDADTFVLDIARGEHLEAFVQALGPTSGQSLGFSGPGGTGLFIPTNSPAPEIRHTGRFTVVQGGRYTASVAGATVPYRFAIQRFNVAPEHHTQPLILGSVVADEIIDMVGDVDEFRLSAPAGTEAVVKMFPAATSFLRLDVIDPSTNTLLRTRVSGHSGRFTFPASGAVTLQVYAALEGQGATGPYRLEPVRIDRAPESVGAQVAIGDTISGESIDPDGDVDEFKVTLSAGTLVAVYFQPAAALRVELVEPGGHIVIGGTPLTGVPTLLDWRTTIVPLTVSGEYIVRVRTSDDVVGSGAYRFMVATFP